MEIHPLLFNLSLSTLLCAVFFAWLLQWRKTLMLWVRAELLSEAVGSFRRIFVGGRAPTFIGAPPSRPVESAMGLFVTAAVASASLLLFGSPFQIPFVMACIADPAGAGNFMALGAGAASVFVESFAIGSFVHGPALLAVDAAASTAILFGLAMAASRITRSLASNPSSPQGAALAKADYELNVWTARRREALAEQADIESALDVWLAESQTPPRSRPGRSRSL